ncbi:MAG: diguanylate cyclase [Rhodoferax sp.]|nr:diguanylate cyclase [Rhodoferax sp.]
MPATTEPRRPDNHDSSFSLLRRFGMASLLAFVVVAALLGYVFRVLSVDNLINDYQSQHVNHARIIANETWDEHFGPLIRETAGLPNLELATNSHIPRIYLFVQKLLEGTSIFKIKVYDLKGRTVYSSDLSQIGQDKSGNAGVIAALQGHSSSQLVHHDQLSTFEGELTDRDMVESYIPRHDPDTGQVTGVFEIYRDATEVLKQIRQREFKLVGSVIALLALLYLTVFSIVKRAQGRLVAQSLARQRAQEALAESEERWKFALEGAGDGVWDRNLQTGQVIFSKRYKSMYGFTDDELENRSEPWDARVHPDDLPRVIAERETYFRGSTPSYVSERRMHCKDGSWKWILSRGMVVSRDAQGKPLRMIGTHSDITERHKHEQALQLSSTVLHTMDEAVTVTDASNTIISVNPAFTVVTGYDSCDVIGKTPSLLASGTHDDAFYQQMWQGVNSPGGWHGEIRNRRKSGQLYVEWLSIKRVCDAQGVLTNYVAVFSDISERKASEERMHHLAHYDVLTELPNRALLGDRLSQAVAVAQREQQHLALMFIDLDKFKPVNDTLGHPVGDQLLQAVAARLKQCVLRDSDTVARIGGDEFVVMLLDVASVQDAMVVATKIRNALEQPFVLGAHTVSISSSLGIAIYPEHGDTEAVLLKNADTAMYYAKDSGRNRVQIFRDGLNAI